ncbi:MAG TPA: extracellular solute-binding protein, partial [Chloroflexota bacterium]|nr:extracellular solute-binding protein [Chloroflexota bacterium]
AALLAACGGGSTAAPGGGAKPHVKLTYLSWRPVAMEQFAPAWKEYQAKNNVTIEVDPSNLGNQEKLITMISSDTGPDLWDANTSTLPKMYDSGWVLEVSKYLTRDKLTLDRDWAPLGVERWRQKTYSVPYWLEPFGIFYNKTLFRSRGVDDPWEKSKGQWTIEQMVDAARKINNPSQDVYGMQWGMGDYHGIGPLVWTHGVSHLQYDPVMKFDLQLPQYAAALDTALDWMNRQKFNIVGPSPEMAASRTNLQAGKPAIDQSNGWNLFSSGKIGIHYRSVNDWRRMWNSIGTTFEWDMLPVPSMGGKPGAAWSAGHPVCAYAKTKSPDACWDFMKYLMQDDFQGFLAENQFLVPAKKKHQPRFFRVPSQYPYQHPAVFADVYKKPYGIYWNHYRSSEDSALYNAEIGKIIRGEMSVQGTLKDLEVRLNALIETGPGENPYKGIRWPIQPK